MLNMEILAALAKMGFSQILLTQINYSPVLFINGVNYKGSYLNQKHLVETVCLAF